VVLQEGVIIDLAEFNQWHRLYPLLNLVKWVLLNNDNWGLELKQTNLHMIETIAKAMTHA